ncbi:hypothetical protein Dester_1077 [Desulfurobacterium thermolithotrophum DSM 11699]|uniref:Pentapeptide repeat protein n=1 Tax=Desulfurobacterium thermolithotrophum (strain DSM 11699 / BSA) TaxID=868864 RepID=F0S033_DESTD|nr:hypothetical protein Dester_1077 [Desulfurobacterium thermolithotrophum DSM 11699]
MADFRETVFENHAVFEEAVFKNEATFWKARFHKGVSFESVTFKDEIDFAEITFKEEAVFRKADFKNRVYFKVTNESLPFVFNLSGIKLSKSSYIEVRNLRTLKLALNNVNNTTDNFLFFDMKIEKFKDLEENRRRNLRRENYLPNIEIKSSILNNMKFINCDFSEAEQIKIENSSLTETEFINVDWGGISEKRICPKLFEGSPEEVEKARDVYRQLKLALDNQKDHINANEFYSLEMKAYERVLQEKPWRTHFQKKLVFSIHKFASNFGQSWLRPLILLILLTIGEMGAQLDFKSFVDKCFYFLIPYPLIVPSLSLLLLIFKKRENLLLWGISVIFALSGFIAFNEALPCISSPPDNWQLTLKILLENFAETLNIFSLFRNNQVINIKFLHTLYSIAIAFLTYQMIVAIRRQVRR